MGRHKRRRREGTDTEPAAVKALREENEGLKLTNVNFFLEAGCQAPQEKDKEVKLPTEVWAIIAGKLDKNDVCSFALVSKQLREAQVLAGRKLVTKLARSLYGYVSYFTEDWCAYWSRKFNVYHTDPEVIKRVLYVAARRGYLEVFEKYWSQGPQEKLSKLWDERTCMFAAHGGHLEVLKWLRAKGCPWDEETSNEVACEGHLEVLQWMRAQDLPYPWTSDVCYYAAHYGHLEVLRWARSQGCPWDEEVSRAAARNGHLEVLQWMRAQDPPCPWTSSVCFSAAFGGHLDVLRWARSQGFPLEAVMARAAAMNGHLEVLQWMRAQDPPCPWDSTVCYDAARSGHLEVLKWVIKEGCPYDTGECRRAAKYGGERAREVLEWLDD